MRRAFLTWGAKKSSSVRRASTPRRYNARSFFLPRRVMRPVRNVGLALVALAFAGSSAVAQRTPPRSTTRSSTQSTLWEIGADGGLGLELSVPAGANKTTTLQIPLSSIRAGFFINDQWSLEP